MRSLADKRYWLVGASEGLGRALAVAMDKAGAKLVLSARSEDRLRALADDLSGSADVVPVDISDTKSVQTARDAAGEIDGIVFLAGIYWPLKATEWDAQKVEAMCDVNFTGAARVLGTVVPGFVEKDRGHVVITGSLSGFRGLPGATGYGASKAGTMYMAEGLYADLWKTGVDVQLVNPGFIRTRLTDKNDFTMPFIMEPDEAARIIVQHMRTGGFKRSFPTGFSLVFRASQLLPDWLYYRLFTGS
ncbi:MAG: SDR family NAD(P)-dependent oxidoreductase [Pseudomonadota bacterium]